VNKMVEDQTLYVLRKIYPIVIITTTAKYIVSDTLKNTKVIQPLYLYFEMVVQT